MKNFDYQICSNCVMDTSDPEISFDEVIEKNLNVMDMTAFTLCKENNLPIVVFDMNKTGNLQRLIDGENIGTRVSMEGAGGQILDVKHSSLQPNLNLPA